MSEKTTKTGQNSCGTTSYKPEKKWREANQCEPSCYPSYPDPKNCEVIREKESKETYFVLNTAQSEQKDSNSNLARLLLGLATLLFLGSLLSNLLMAWTLVRASSNTNHSKEVTTTTREVVREIDRTRWAGDEYYYYAPAARW